MGYSRTSYSKHHHKLRQFCICTVASITLAVGSVPTGSYAQAANSSDKTATNSTQNTSAESNAVENKAAEPDTVEEVVPRVIVKLTEEQSADLAFGATLPTLIAKEKVIAHAGRAYLIEYADAEAADQAIEEYSTECEYAEKDFFVYAASADDAGNSATQQKAEASTEDMANAGNTGKNTSVAQEQSGNSFGESLIQPANANANANANTNANEQASSQPFQFQLPFFSDNATQQDDKIQVAVLDSGTPKDSKSVDNKHAVNIVGGNSSDNLGHAFRVISIIEEQAPDAEIIPIKVLDDNGVGTAFSVYSGMLSAMDAGADIINLSLAGESAGESYTLSDAVSEATEKGVVVVGAAGNDAADASKYVPAQLDGVIAVGAADADGYRQPDSNYGKDIDIWSAAPDTSEAAALASGWLAANSEFNSPVAALQSQSGKGTFFSKARIPQKKQEEQKQDGQEQDDQQITGKAAADNADRAAADKTGKEVSATDSNGKAEGDPESSSMPVCVIAKALLDDDASLTAIMAEPVLLSYDDVHILEYPNLAQARDAAARLAPQCEFAEVDEVVEAAGDADDANPTSGDGEAGEPPVGSELLFENPQEEWLAGSNDDDRYDEHDMYFPDDVLAEDDEPPTVALLDSGAPESASVREALTVLGGTTADTSGHAAKVLSAIREHAPEADVISIKVLDKDNVGSVSSTYAGIMLAMDRNVDIINLSLSARAGAAAKAIDDAVEKAQASGIVVVTAAGNAGENASAYTPANIDGVITVGACDESGKRLLDSNWGECVDVYAPAESTSVAAGSVTGWLAANLFITASTIDEAFADAFDKGIFHRNELLPVEDISDDEAAADDVGNSAVLGAADDGIELNNPTKTELRTDYLRDPDVYPKTNLIIRKQSLFDLEHAIITANDTFVIKKGTSYVTQFRKPAPDTNYTTQEWAAGIWFKHTAGKKKFSYSGSLSKPLLTLHWNNIVENVNTGERYDLTIKVTNITGRYKAKDPQTTEFLTFDDAGSLWATSCTSTAGKKDGKYYQDGIGFVMDMTWTLSAGKGETLPNNIRMGMRFSDVDVADKSITPVHYWLEQDGTYHTEAQYTEGARLMSGFSKQTYLQHTPDSYVYVWQKSKANLGGGNGFFRGSRQNHEDKNNRLSTIITMMTDKTARIQWMGRDVAQPSGTLQNRLTFTTKTSLTRPRIPGRVS